MANQTPGYSASAARSVTGASQRQLDYWNQIALVQPSVRKGAGAGKTRRYSYADLVNLSVVVSLRSQGVSLQRIRKALALVDEWTGKKGSWARKRFVVHGQEIYVTTSDRGTLKNVLRQGQFAFSVILVGDVAKEAARRIRLYETIKATGS